MIINNNRREVGPLQASAVGPVQTAAPIERANGPRSMSENSFASRAVPRAAQGGVSLRAETKSACCTACGSVGLR